MRFDDLNATIPYARYGKAKSLSMEPYPNIKLMMPGRHAEDTSPKGGDFVVCVTNKKAGWVNHQFTHTDIFNDMEKRLLSSSCRGDHFMDFYLGVIAHQVDPTVNFLPDAVTSPLDNITFFTAIQCLAIAEHRRYAQHEPKFGGRFLPFRFAAGISEMKWRASDAIDKQKRGRIGVEWLEKDYGMPDVTKKLMGLDTAVPVV